MKKPERNPSAISRAAWQRALEAVMLPIAGEDALTVQELSTMWGTALRVTQRHLQTLLQTHRARYAGRRRIMDAVGRTQWAPAYILLPAQKGGLHGARHAHRRSRQ